MVRAHPEGRTVPPQRHKASFTFITRRGFATRTLAHMLDSLVRVSRRADWEHSASVLSAQVQAAEQRASCLGQAPGSVG